MAVNSEHENVMSFFPKNILRRIEQLPIWQDINSHLQQTINPLADCPHAYSPRSKTAPVTECPVFV
eukprot:284814894_2